MREGGSELVCEWVCVCVCVCMCGFRLFGFKAFPNLKTQVSAFCLSLVTLNPKPAASCEFILDPTP